MKLFYLIILTYIIIDSIFRFIMRWRKDIILSFDKAGINSCFLTEPILWEKVSDIDLNSATFTKEIVIFCDNKVSFFRRLTIINKSFFHKSNYSIKKK